MTHSAQLYIRGAQGFLSKDQAQLGTLPGRIDRQHEELASCQWRLAVDLGFPKPFK